MMAFGALLISVGLLSLAAAAITARKPDAPRWTTASWPAIAVVTALTFGVADFITGVAGAYREGPHLVDLALLAVVLCGAFVIWRRLDVWARTRTPVPNGRPGAVCEATERADAGASEPPSSSRTL